MDRLRLWIDTQAGGHRGHRRSHLSELALTAGQLAQVTQPVQLIWGEDDPMGSPSVGKRVAQIVPNSQLQVVAGGHTPWLDHAEQISPVVASFFGKHRQT